MSRTYRGPRLGDVVSSLGDLSLAAVFLCTWLWPGSGLALPLTAALLTMLLEFIAVHSTAFMGSVSLGRDTRREKATAILGLGGFYTLFVGGFALGFSTWKPLIAFWVLTLNRALGVVFGGDPTRAQEMRIRKSWAAVTLSYLLAVGVTTVLPVPSFGIDATAVREAAIPGSGLWVSQPWRVVAAGFLHFLFCGLSELFGHRWLSDRSIPNAGSAGMARRGEA